MKTDESRAKKNEYVSYDSENPDFPLGFGNTEEEAIERGYDNVGDQNFDKSRIEVEKNGKLRY